jgi:DNA-binding transcriptional LysR family regulator
MDLQKFNYILKVAQTGNITKAAEELYMTQPALSRFIARVESEEGITIFDRSTSPMSLTYEGRLYVETIKKMVELNDLIRDELSEISASNKGELSIGIPQNRAISLLPEVLPEFTAKYPNVKIRTSEHNTEGLREDILKGRVDFAILPITDQVSDLKCEELFKEELFLISTKDHLPESSWHLNEDGQKVADITALKDERFILLKPGYGIRTAIDLLFGYHGVKPKIFLETTANETAFSLAAAGLGLAIVPERCLKTQKHPRPVDTFKLSDSGMKWTIGAIFTPGSRRKLFAEKFIQIVREKYNG